VLTAQTTRAVLDQIRRMIQPPSVRGMWLDLGGPIVHQQNTRLRGKRRVQPRLGRGRRSGATCLYGHVKITQVCRCGKEARRFDLGAWRTDPASAQATPGPGQNTKELVSLAFSEATKDQAYARSGGRCECTRQDGLHQGRCPTRVPRRGQGVEYHHLTAESVGGSDGLSNCQVLCTRCHQRTASYGRQ
jgi:HNH endonuclease